MDTMEVPHLVTRPRHLTLDTYRAQAWDKTFPTITVHGHYHHRYVDRFMNIHGLQCDGDPRSIAVLDTDDLTLATGEWSQTSGHPSLDEQERAA